MRRLRRAAAVVLAFAVVAGGALGVAAWQRSNEVAAQRASSKEKAAAVRGNATLSLDDACWVAKDWFHHGDGLAGFNPLVECDGSLEPVSGGLKLTRVLTQSELLQGHHVRTLCLVRGEVWEVLGDAWHFDDCRSLPAGLGAKDARVALRAGIASLIQTARAEIEVALETAALAPPTCPAELVLRSEQLLVLDASRLSAGDQRVGGLVPHEARWSACDPTDAGTPLGEGFSEFICRRSPEWTHALVFRVTVDEPEIQGNTFSGGRVTGDAVVVDLSRRSALCLLPVEIVMQERVIARQGAGASEVRSKFTEAARAGFEAIEQRLVKR
jgi:hypothetical protein